MVIEHVAMYVNDMEKARDFFVSLLNGKSNDGYYNEKTGFTEVISLNNIFYFANENTETKAT